MSAYGTPTLTGQPTAAMTEIQGLGAINMLRIPTSVTPTSSYDTGGSAVTLPAGVQGWTLHAVEIKNWNNGTRMYCWDGSVSAPKIKALTALPATEALAAADLHTDAALKVEFVYVK